MIDRIEGPDSSSVRSEQVSPSRPAERGQDDEVAAGALREDRLDISARARAKAASTEPSDVAGLSNDRLAKIRQRLASGIYDLPEVVDVVLQRMIQQGDL